MVLENIKSKKGFTIVELLVVIVVIGILAAITVVSYTGVTNKANTKANLSNAKSVLSAALSVHADTGAFPVASASPLAALNAGVAKLPTTGLTVTNAQIAAGSTIQYLVNGTGTGVCVGYWNYETGPAANYIYGGAATAGVNGATPTCS